MPCFDFVPRLTLFFFFQTPVEGQRMGRKVEKQRRASKNQSVLGAGREGTEEGRLWMFFFTRSNNSTSPRQGTECLRRRNCQAYADTACLWSKSRQNDEGVEWERLIRIEKRRSRVDINIAAFSDRKVDAAFHTTTHIATRRVCMY